MDGYVPSRFKKRKRPTKKDDDETKENKPKSPRKRPSSGDGSSPKKRAKSKTKEGKKKGPTRAVKGKMKIPTKEEVLAVVKHIFDKEQQRAAGKKKVTLMDLGLTNVSAVEALQPLSVRMEIEKIICDVTESIMRGEGFKFDVPNRKSSNQLYIPELDRIVLKDSKKVRDFVNAKNARKCAIMLRILSIIYESCCKRIHITKRDLFYQDVKLFTKQNDSDVVLDDVACMIGSTRTSLRVIASEKGVVVGCIQFNESGDEIDCMKQGKSGKAIPAQMNDVSNIRGTARFILLVEKEAAFQRLAEDRFYRQYPCIIMTAKGQPDVASRLFLKKVKTKLNIPVLGLVDADPYGLKILSVYLSGSKNMSYDSASLACSDIKWLGVRPSDLDRLQIPEQCRLKMTEEDVKCGKNLLNEDFIKKNPQWIKELEWMIEHRVKAEIQALSSFDLQYLTKVYLPVKLRDMDWI